MKKTKIYKPTVMSLVFGVCVSLIKNNLRSESQPLEITTVGKYNLESTIAKEHGLKNFFTGIYSDKQKLVFIKTWKGKMKDINYYLLINEYLTGTLFTKQMHKLSKTNITFPKVIDFCSSQDSFSVVYEYISGEPLSGFSEEKQVEILFEAVKLLGELTKTLNKQDKETISSRNYSMYVISYPVIFLSVLLLNLKNWRAVINSFLNGANSIKSIAHKDLTLAHRDLNPNNIIVGKGKTYILDCERIVLTVPSFDITHMLIARANRQIRAKLSKLFGYNALFPNSFLRSYICLHYILSLNHAKKTKDYYFRTLQSS